MRLLLSVLLIASLDLVFAQQRQLRCYECEDCNSVEDNFPLRQCYGPGPDPTHQTTPITISLTPPTTTTPMPPNVIQPNPNEQIFPQVEPASSVITSRQSQHFVCFTIRRHIGDRHLTHRGCALAHLTDELACQSANYGEDPDFCELCNEDECNDTSVTGGARTIFTSLSLIFAALFIIARLN